MENAKAKLGGYVLGGISVGCDFTVISITLSSLESWYEFDGTTSSCCIFKKSKKKKGEVDRKSTRLNSSH